MEQQIKERLNRIKEEVRSEIEQIKANGNSNLEEDVDEEEEEDGRSQRFAGVANNKSSRFHQHVAGKSATSSAV